MYAKNFCPGTKTNYPQWFDPAAFTPAAPGTFGKEQPFPLRGPGYVNMDAAIPKFFTIHNQARLELRGEGVNVLNHPNYNNPVDSITTTPQLAALKSSTVGLITSTVNDARILQIAAKTTF